MSTEDTKKEWSKPMPEQPFGAPTRPGEVVVRMAGKMNFTNQNGGRYDGAASVLFVDHFDNGTHKAIDAQLNAWAVANPDANIIHLQPMGENALLAIWIYRRTPEEVEELEWTSQAIYEFMEKKRQERFELEAQAKKEQENEESARQYYERTGRDFHATKALLKTLEVGLGGKKAEDLARLHKALHNGELFAALGVEVPAHLKPAPKAIELPASPIQEAIMDAAGEEPK